MISRSVVEGMERDVRGTRKTLDRMHTLVAKGKIDPTMQKIATWIRLQVPKDRRGATRATADAVFRFVKRHGVFQRDPFQVEKIEHPIAAMEPVIQARQRGAYDGPGLFVGDCDTLAGVWTATLLGILGFHYAWEVAKVDPSRPEEFSHVWVAAKIGPDWYALDPSTKGAVPGWRPPVPPDKFARFPEKPIEDVIGGSAMNGLGDDDGDAPDGYFGEDYIGYGIPKDIGYGGRGFIPQNDGANLQPLIPPDTEIPEASLRGDLKYLTPERDLGPSRRIGGKIVGQPDTHGPPYYRNGRQPYEKIESRPYAPGSPWNKNIRVDTGKYRSTRGPRVRAAVPGTPERQVEAFMRGAIPIRRREVVLRRPVEVPEGMDGMGSDFMTWDSLTSTATKAGEQTVQQTVATAEQTSQSIFDQIAKTIEAAIPAAAGAVIARTEAHYAEKIADATNKVAGAAVVSPTTVGASRLTSSGKWYTQPWLLAGGALAVGAAAYAFWPRGRKGGRRRRR